METGFVTLTRKNYVMKTSESNNFERVIKGGTKTLIVLHERKAERHKEKMKMLRVNILSQLRLPTTVNSNTGAFDTIHLILRKKITLSLSFRCQK